MRAIDSMPHAEALNASLAADSFAVSVNGTARHVSRAEWYSLPLAERQNIAFAHIGCAHAFPSWWQGRDAPRADCIHLDCMSRRGELNRPLWLAVLNGTFRAELHNGWLRFAAKTPEGRRHCAELYRAMKRAKSFDIMSAVWIGVLA